MVREQGQLGGSDLMKRIPALVIATAFCISPLAFAQSASDASAIERTIRDYFEGHGTADRKRLENAFAVDAASMVGAVKNKNGYTELKAWKDLSKVVDRWSNNPNPGGADRNGEIVSLNVVDGRIATVIFRFTDEYYDAFTLLKLDDGSWKIANKTFINQ
jgi:hypothetical protein